MQTALVEQGPRLPDSEKITINLGHVDLGQIDLLVREGFYGNRTDFIRTAIRNQVDRHADALRQCAQRRALDLGLRHITRAELEQARQEGRMLSFRVLGLASLSPDISPALARDTIAAMTVLGALHATPEQRAALAGRLG